MQNYFLPMASPIMDNVFSVVEACHLKKIKTNFTCHGHRDIEKDGGMLLKCWGDCILYGTGLDELLKSRVIEEIIITGVMTYCCCETTARDAFMRDYRVFFVSDATATVNEELHLG